MKAQSRTAERPRSQRAKASQLLGQAKAIGRLLVRTTPGIEGICLYGSVARGDTNDWSDIDLLVIGSESHISSARLLKTIRREYQSVQVSILYFATTNFLARCNREALFVAHVLREGRVLYDRRGVLRKMLTLPTPSKVRMRDEIRARLSHLDVYEKLERFNGNFLFCLAHLYSIGTGIIMLCLAKRGLLEFNREQAFRRFAILHPSLADDVAMVAETRPFYNLVSRRSTERLPFPYRDVEDRVRQVVKAIRSLARAEA
jgi:predicted nucleotidyltransferase